VYTSYFGNLKKLPADLKPVCIARGRPRFFSGAAELRLAPTREMLKLPRPQYDALFKALLEKLDPKELAQDLGDKAVMLCWEKPGEGCHRRIVAEWFETNLGIVVPEYGVQRDITLSYAATPWATAKKPAKTTGLSLF
jgi:hypothetical protein